MKYAIQWILMIGVTTGALLADELYAQGADANSAPNPYEM
jgi:hypothetical protein